MEQFQRRATRNKCCLRGVTFLLLICVSPSCLMWRAYASGGHPFFFFSSFSSSSFSQHSTESRQDQEEGGELDSHEETTSPEEMKSRWVELGWRVGLLLLQLFPNGGTMDIVFVTLFCIAVGTAIAWRGGCCTVLDRHCLNILLIWRWSTAALVFWVVACFEV